MGNTSSTPKVALVCKYNKKTFNELLEVIRDAHNVTELYANYVLEEKLPIQLEEYRNYSESTEEYFNKTRKEIKDELGMSMYQFYNYLSTLNTVYETPDITEKERRKLVTDVFHKCYSIQRYLIEDIWYSCDSQN